ncbi:hypothetical protein FSP39_014557 [Pinctada imbricata]|uniref:F-box domain-containing protein n=1 Tax=Pinctada imbricata TaxID=66713 RepID=A0AA88XZA8_PINIB|nr:hypothetical protein FSP39_014557 [Pinctada imbricata]
MAIVDWSELPEHIVARIISYLPLRERSLCCFVCKFWSDAFSHPIVWSHFVFSIEKSENFSYPNYPEAITKYGHLMKKIKVDIDQGHIENRRIGHQIICALSSIPNKKYKSVSFNFTGANPLFYSGLEYIEALKRFFGNETTHSPSSISEVDLSNLTVPFDDSVINLLAQNHPGLEKLNLVNKVLVNKVSPDSLYNLIYKCRRMKDLKVFYTSMTEEIMLALADYNRVPLNHLGLSCRREVKFLPVLSSESWANLVSMLPDLKVTLFFDHTCPLKKVSRIMKPEIPVQVLQLETFTMIYSELNQACMYYQNTLEMLVLHTRYSEELGKALCNLANCCTKMKEIYVYCVLKKWVVDEVLANLPKVRESGRYILRWKESPEPWVVGIEEGD